jgi:nickel-type superoxide dismutase maturation protease
MLGKLGALLPLARYRVAGQSMTPGLVEGERVLVNKAAYWFARPRPDDVVVLRDPRTPARLLIKRIERAAGADAWEVAGDNPDASTDSRAFGPVQRGHIVGKVWLRY